MIKTDRKEINGIVFKKCLLHNVYFPLEDEYIIESKDNFYYQNGKSTSYCKKCYKIKHLIKWNEKGESESHKKWREENKVTLNKRSREWIKENNEQYSEYMDNYRKNNKDKIKKYGEVRSNKNHKISTKEWNSCLEYFNHCCAYCGIHEDIAKQEQGQYLHKEHVNHEGDNNLSNCVPSCKSCNSQKWKFKLEEWYNKENPRYTKERFDKIHRWLNEDYKLHIKINKNIGA